MGVKSALFIMAVFAAANVQYVLAACAETGAVCVHSDECCSGACSPVFNYCLPQ
ncbi:conotoxin-like protein 1 [Orgyia pseudotsugata multiple nucleopolyhedrovirus]|uniref:Conotoxin-like peptide 1 n=1 Tax=Orgyia pseudotsugata multicapsid polyhedrosis virus TaxID=262177 RepID=CXOL1_NPVOP|nr:conotoxin-like protein 1 [Orgyia pseudotsugata multiple nucleopolyhedrovirus]O10367.1 RecName: Full=Conotoxin-like peptide 1; Flags: Precursor [Orgyia pseudotsugata multiple nucleopolyhedrovirus]pir/T10405/ conotoxin-like protein 1 - Orgyia pseudotsugata nuclear polyhedrosis virus [Orgyia pseudotsugata single capsid nuclopolyhedrovirus]AKR14096.1 conotoxin-like protein 1 [Dasychira pudibunda nucleopolyhedrovirus]AAC59135.1 conotoxin-like protein 1 [Orgyia pseudotsugata multiple nucleopolyhed